jgi:hypothetical protein
MHRDGKIKPDRYDKMVALLGFTWLPTNNDPTGARYGAINSVWDWKFKELQSYQKKHGHTHIQRVSYSVMIIIHV